MIRILALLCIIAAPTFALWEKGFCNTFGLNPFTAGKDHFVKKPQNLTAALAAGWEKVTKPKERAGYEALDLYCNLSDLTVCLYYDDTGYIAGLQTAFDADSCTASLYGWDESGFTKWTITVNSTTYTYYTIAQFYISAALLQTDADTRIANRDDTVLFQDSALYLEDVGGKLLEVPTTASGIKSSVFTEQACIFMMGRHYYYNVTSSLECSADTISHWFPLVYNDQLVGLGLLAVVDCTFDSSTKVPYENPSSTVIKLIVPDGPDCFYNLGDTPGIRTLHTYFIKDPYYISCIW